jgi:hypothetical protein
MRALIRLLGLCIFAMPGVDAAQACFCDAVSPSEGFDRAQYVFTGKVVEAEHHTWLVAVDRVWRTLSFGSMDQENRRCEHA